MSPVVGNTPDGSTTWTPEQTATLMGWLLEYQRTMEKYDIEFENYSSMFEHVLALAVKKWPDLAPLISTRSIYTNFDRERQRYGALRAWVEDFGGSCDPDDGRCEVDRSDKRWKRFKSAASFRTSAWVSSGLPLGDLKVYQEVWGYDVATGAYIERPQDIPRVEPDLIQVLQDDRWRPAYGNGSQRKPSETLGRPPELSNKQWHELVTDPDWVASRRSSRSARQ